MDVAMGILGSMAAAAAASTAPPTGVPNLVAALSQAPAVPTTAPASAQRSAGTTLLEEKIEAGRKILAMMQEVDRQNLDRVKEFMELAKAYVPTAYQPAKE